ncbi:MAG: flagellar motor stator protein MotA [Brevundimonas sp.]|uniref:Flagellar motor stator protein MotA n=1 Tax=Brevundimonas albigilva TaxID=1312364 RepID=A0ABY4SJ39_9CAUL|nr:MULTISPECIES: flagellar motor stator protein MotA [Brevundimonas]MBK5956398.1 flagellar motor stator protein MotA [Rhodospirillum rubrum]MCV0414060.1 flagellar motor stator protein MotA [Brevundimonas sp.]PZU54812.1 MAG: flagellar motor stator protein MotA [Brevundimonas sp.]URI14264.1 flagellar motor stator protein MotA [Brevundimonas albigilva]
MFQIIGIVLLFGMVFGSYLLAGGKMAVILHSLPFELMGILGSGVAAFVIANSMDVIKATLGGFGRIFGGPKWKKQDYKELLSLLFQLTKTMKSKGVVALESHIEKPKESPIFQKYPKVLKDHFAVDFICDTLRMMTMNLEDPHQVEDAMEKQLEKHHHEAQAGAHALQNMADALPALGIVIAVLGVIKTMGSITEPPEVLGGMIGGALVGTFLGVFLAYGMIGPFATRLKDIVEQDGAYYKIIQSVLVAHLHGNAAQISVEIGRGDIPSVAQPSFVEMEETLNSLTE